MWDIVFHNKLKFVIYTAFKLINTVVLLYFSFLVRDLINIVSTANQASIIINYALKYLLYCCILVIVNITCDKIGIRYLNKTTYNLQNQYFNAIMNNTLEVILRKESSYYISAILNDCNMIFNNFIMAIFLMIDSILMIIGSLLCVLIISWQIALIMLVLTLILSFLPLVLSKPLDHTNENLSKSLNNYTSIIKDNLMGVDVIKSYNVENIVLGKIEKSTYKLMKSKIRNADMSLYMSVFSSTISNIIKISVILATAYFVMLNKLDIGSITAIMTLVVLFYSPLMQFSKQIGCIAGTKYLRRKYHSIMKQKIKSNNLNSRVEYDDIILENVSCSYNGIRKILSNVSFVFKKNKKYLIIGTSGGGKSTLLNLLNKIKTDYVGAIRIGNNNYNDLQDKDINHLIAFSKQKAYLFNDSIRYNIDLNHTEDYNKLIYCINKCQLNNFINSLPEGIDTCINEEVNKISEGEKLRISLARALFKDSKILLLDEITAALDTQNSLEIEKMILGIEDTTVINICHKFSLDIIKQYDQILIIEEGKIITHGTYKELIGKEIFKKYIKEQLQNEN